MPYIYDFKNLHNVKTEELIVSGWITPIHIEYAIGKDLVNFGDMVYYWRVKGTQHTFKIPVSRMNYLSQGDINSHFKYALEVFREDYLSWKEKGFETAWSREYKDQFERYIL